MLLDVRAKNLDCEPSLSWAHFFAYLRSISNYEDKRDRQQQFEVEHWRGGGRVLRMSATAIGSVMKVSIAGSW